MKYEITVSKEPRITVLYDDSIRPASDVLKMRWRQLSPTKMLAQFGIVATNEYLFNEYFFKHLYERYYVRSVSYGLYQARYDIRGILCAEDTDVEMKVNRVIKTIPYWMAKYLRPNNHPMWHPK